MVALLHNAGYLPDSTHLLRRDAKAVSSSSGAFLMARFVMPSGPGAFHSLSLLIVIRTLAIVKDGFHPAVSGIGDLSDRSQGMVGPPVASNRRSVCSVGSLVSVLSDLRRGGSILEAGGPLVYAAAVNRSLAVG